MRGVFGVEGRLERAGAGPRFEICTAIYYPPAELMKARTTANHGPLLKCAGLLAANRGRGTGRANSVGVRTKGIA